MTTLRRLVAVILLLYESVWECLKDCSDFESFEKRVRGWLTKVGCEILNIIFEAVDETLMQERDPNLRVVGFRERTIVTIFGEMKLRRRLYEDKVTGETRFLLDERLGLEKRDRVSAGVKELAVRLSTEMPFRRAADVLSEITPGISPMTAWNIVKEAGEEARLEGQRLRERVFERGEDPGGSRKAEKLHIEADGVSIAIQRGSKKRDEVKVGTAYEGKESQGNRVRLKERRVMAGVLNEGAFWEEALARVAEHWDVGGLRAWWSGGTERPG